VKIPFFDKNQEALTPVMFCFFCTQQDGGSYEPETNRP
jgi:hypothetical protein